MRRARDAEIDAGVPSVWRTFGRNVAAMDSVSVYSKSCVRTFPVKENFFSLDNRVRSTRAQGVISNFTLHLHAWYGELESAQRYCIATLWFLDSLTGNRSAYSWAIALCGPMAAVDLLH
jgi:hypothetical protein